MNTKAIPQINTLLAKMPSGRNIHDIPDFQPPSLDRHVLDAMRAMPNAGDDFVNDMSSDDDFKGASIPAVGAFPGASGDYGRSSTTPSSQTYF